MKLIFDYTYRDLCYGEERIVNQRNAEAEITEDAEIRLSPCDKKVKVRVYGDVAALEFPDGSTVTASAKKTPFNYCESYELFDDVREKEIEGFVWTEQSARGKG